MKKHKKLIIILVIVAIVVGLGIWVSSCAKKATNLLANMNNSAKTATVEERDITNSISASGTITSLSTHSLTATLAGVKVEQLNVSLGDKVSKDQIICLLDDSDLEDRLDDAKYSQDTASKLTGIEKNSVSRALNDAVETQQIEVERANEKIEKAQSNLNKYENKANEAYNKYADAHNKSVEADNKVKEAQADVDSLKDETEEIQNRISELKDSFKNTKEELISYLEKLADKGVDVDASSVINLEIGQAASLSISSIYRGDSENQKDKIKEAVYSLRKDEEKIANKKLKLEEVKGKIAQGKLKVEGLKAEYDALVKAEDLLKEAYEVSAEAVTPYKDALTQTIQMRDDTVRTTNQSIAARKDSVSTTNINSASNARTAENNVEKIEEQIDDCEIKSPVDGIITSINVKEGESYAGGAIVTIEDTSSYEVTAYIDEYDIAKVVVGQKVNIKTNATGDTILEGVVKTVSPRAEKALSSVQYKIVVSVITPNDTIRLDMTAKLEIILEEKAGVLAVPYDAIQVDEKGNFYVEVLDSGSPIDYTKLTDGSASQEDIKKMRDSDSSYTSHRVTVTKGLESDYYVEIFSDELKAGTTIVIPANDLFSNIGIYVNETGATGGF